MKTATALLPLALLVAACSTTVRAYPVGAESPRKNGIPFYRPKPVLHVKEPIETERTEELFAMIEVGGVVRYLQPMDINNLDVAIKELRKLLGIEPGTKMHPYAPERRPAQTTERTTTKDETHTDKETQGSKNVTNDKSTSAKSANVEKLELVPAPADIEGKSAPFYVATDVAKAYDVLFVPDFEREYELVITPSWFASTKISVGILDGWKLNTIGTETGDNQVVKELSAIAQALIGSRKETTLAEIAKSQALELAKLAQPQTAGTVESAQAAPGFAPNEVGVPVRVVGYVKRVQVVALKPGMYGLEQLLGHDLPTSSATYWVRISF